MIKLKEILPPIIYEGLRQSPLRKYGWFGDYKDWETAEAESKGYESDTILKKVLESTLKVKHGEFPYERDSVLFKEIEYDWALLAALMWAAAKNQGNLNVLDFGGSLGTTYWQNKAFLNLKALQWNIVEQSHFVEIGKKHFEDDTLKFHEDTQTCLAASKPNVILLSGVLSYIKDPYTLLEALCELKIENMILTRFPFINRGSDRLTVQRVPPQIYTATYPAWFFDKEKFLDFIQRYYNVQEIYDCGNNTRVNLRSEIRGIILTLKTSKQ